MNDAESAALLRAVELARQAEGDVEPNPVVGCVILQGDEVVGEGWHRCYGGPHAELDALAAAGERALGATAVVTLEPCSTTGKTGPCYKALVAAGVERVVVGAIDPAPQHAGRGLTMLRGNDVDIEVVDDPDCMAIATVFEAGLSRRRPYVLAKLALSADGCIAGPGGEPVALTGEAANARSHAWRASVDAILVGAQTVANDDPRLTVRGAAALRPLRRVVLDPSLRTSPGARLFHDADTTPVWLCATEDADESAQEALEAEGARVLRLPAGERWLGDVLMALHTEGVGRLLVEGGSRTLAAFLERRLVDQLALWISPKHVGDGGLPGLPGVDLAGLDPDDLAEVFELRGMTTEVVGEDVLVRGRRTARDVTLPR